MKTLKAQILALATKTTQKVQIDGLDEPIYVKKLSVGEFNDLQKQEKEHTQNGDLPLALHFIHFACDSQGKPIFTPAEINEVANLPTDLVSTVNKAGYQLNRLDENPTEALEKNS